MRLCAWLTARRNWPRAIFTSAFISPASDVWRRAAERPTNCLGGAVSEIRHQDLDAVFRMITAANESETGSEQCASFPRYDFLANLACAYRKSNPTRVSESLCNLRQSRSAEFCDHNRRIRNKSEKGGGESL